MQRWDTLDTTVVLVEWLGIWAIACVTLVASTMVGIALAIAAGGTREDAPLSVILAMHIACLAVALNRWHRLLEVAEAELRRDRRATQHGERST